MQPEISGFVVGLESNYHQPNPQVTFKLKYQGLVLPGGTFLCPLASYDLRREYNDLL
jgi:hypothetical protein